MRATSQGRTADGGHYVGWIRYKKAEKRKEEDLVRAAGWPGRGAEGRLIESQSREHSEGATIQINEQTKQAT